MSLAGSAPGGNWCASRDRRRGIPTRGFGSVPRVEEDHRRHPQNAIPASQSTRVMSPRISVFPKCFFDELTDGRMPYEEWIAAAAALGGEGVEHYDGFFRSFAPADVDPIIRLMERTGQVSSM